MKSLRRSLAAWAAVLALSITAPAPEARACASSSSTELVTTLHPDLPLNDYVKGSLGLLKPTFARSYLVIAFRTLNGMPLDATEQAGALDLFKRRLSADPKDIDRTVPPPAPGAAPTPPATPDVWSRQRAAILGGAQPPTLPGATPAPTTAITTAITVNYAQIDNCLADAFTKAAETLADRAKRYGAGSREVREWIAAQDLVFSNCPGSGGKIVPPAANPKDKLVAADRAYQIASSYFYAGDHVEAEKRFRAIAADTDSPWRLWGRYLAARALTRQALLAGQTPDLTLLGKAQKELEGILADANMKPMHHAAHAYLMYVRAHGDVAAATREVSVRLAGQRLGSDFEQALFDYTWLLDADSTPLKPNAPDADRLSAFLGVVQGTTGAAFDRAERLYQKSQSPVWLVAALMKATAAHGARLDPLLDAAKALPAGSPAAVTANYHRLRLLLERGNTKGLFAEILKARAALRPEDGRSTFNEFTRLALKTAPTLDDLLENAFVVPAGEQTDDSPVVPTSSKPPRPADPDGSLYPDAAELISNALPLASLTKAAQSKKLPDPVRARVAAAAWVRAMLLADAKISKQLTPEVVKLHPKLKGDIEKVTAAKTEAERRLAFAHLLLVAPDLGYEVGAWGRGELQPTPIDSSYGGYWWCARDPKAPTVQAPSFVSAADQKALEQERKTLAALPAGATFLAREAIEAADKLPNDPRVPEALHLAVRATRFGCKDTNTSAESKRAFTTLHKKYPKSSWAKETPYYY